MAETSGFKKARGGCGSRGNRRLSGDQNGLLLSGDFRRSHSPTTNGIGEQRIESRKGDGRRFPANSQTAGSVTRIQLHKEPDTSLPFASPSNRELRESVPKAKPTPIPAARTLSITEGTRVTRGPSPVHIHVKSMAAAMRPAMIPASVLLLKDLTRPRRAPAYTIGIPPTAIRSTRGRKTNESSAPPSNSSPCPS
jgi:hypothetical protein